MSIAIEEIVGLGLGINSGTDDNSDDETVNTEHSGHNHRHDRLHHQLRPHHSHRRHSDAALRRPVGSSHTCTATGNPKRTAIRNRNPRSNQTLTLDLRRSERTLSCRLLQEKTRAAAAPRKPKNGAVSSPLKVLDDIFPVKIEGIIGSERGFFFLFFLFLGLRNRFYRFSFGSWKPSCNYGYVPKSTCQSSQC